jgi:hypothetical protein
VGRRGRVLCDPGIFGLSDPPPIDRIVVRLRLAGNWPLVAAEVAGHSRSSPYPVPIVGLGPDGAGSDAVTRWSTADGPAARRLT